MYASGLGISIAAKYIKQWSVALKDPYSDVGIYIEYPSLSQNPIIGNKYISKWEHYADLITSHEVSHAYQFYLIEKNKMDDPIYAKGHGKFFQDIYKILRLEVNKTLPDQIVLHSRYKNLISAARKREMYDV